MSLFTDGSAQKAKEWALPNLALTRDTSFGEAVAATWDATRHNDVSSALARHRQSAYAERLATIKALTGQELENPYNANLDDVQPILGGPAGIVKMGADLLFGGTPAERRERKVEEHELRIAEILDTLSDDQRAMIPSREAIDKKISAEAKRLEERQAEIVSRGGLAGLAGSLVGGMGAVMSQPEQLATLPIGAPAKLGMLGRIAVEAAINAGIETIAQPGIQSGRGQMGLESGVEKGLENIALAGAGGAVFAGGMEGIRALARGGRSAWQARYGRPPNETEAAVLEAAKQSLEADVVAPFESRTAATAAVHNANQEAAAAAAIAGRPVTAGELQGQDLLRRDPIKGGNGPAEFLGNKEILEIGTDAKLMQFKAGGDEFGVTDRLAGITEWEPERSGVLMIYEFEDGRRIIADGHQRLGLAKRLASEGKEVSAFGIVMREIDGVTPAQARVRAALKNMAEGSGTAADAAKVLRDSRATLKDLNLPPRSAIMRDAEGLSRLNDDVFGMVINEQIDERFAAAIGRMVKDELLQTNIAGLLRRVQPNTLFEAEQVIDQARRAGVVHSKQEDLFGEADVAESLYLERARVLERAQKMLRQDASTFRTLLDRGDDIADMGNVLDQTQNAARLANDQKVMQFVRALSNRKGPISDGLTDAAAAAKASGNYAAAAREFLGSVNGRLDDPEYAGAIGRGDWGADEYTAPERAVAEELLDRAEFVPDDATLSLFDDPTAPAAVEQTARLQREIAQAVSDSDGGFALPEKGAPVSLLHRPANQIKRIEAEFKARAPERSVEEYHSAAQPLQTELEALGKKLGRRKGVTFKTKGVKDLAGAADKMARKGYSSTRELTDIVRAGFEVETPAQARGIVDALAKQYRVLDEGWKTNGALYFDRKVMVQFDDGTIGEVQIWNPDLLKAKKSGHKLYSQMRKLPEGSPEYRDLLAQQRRIYGDAIDQLSSDWLDEVWISAAASGGNGGTLAKIWPNMRSATGVPESRTSATAAGDHSLSPERMNSARESSMTTAGRPSQLKNETVIDQSPSDGAPSIDGGRADAQGGPYGEFADEAGQADMLNAIRSEGQDLRELEIPIGERIDADGNRVAETQTLGDLLDELDADDEFLKQLAICDRSAR